MPRSSPLLCDPRIRFCLDDTRVDSTAYKQALSMFGILLLELKFEDKQAQVLKGVVKDLGQVDVHDRRGTTIWDIKYDARVDQATAARSLTTREFTMHTDASFETHPPKYIAMYVLQEDRLGGGVSQIIQGSRVLPELSDRSKLILQNSRFKIRVPAEFLQQHHFSKLPLLDTAGNFRYRRELIVEEECNQRQINALEELDSLLTDTSLIESIFLNTGTIMILDNHRFFHARTEVKDKNRHLLRMRFNPKLAIHQVKAA